MDINNKKYWDDICKTIPSMSPVILEALSLIDDGVSDAKKIERVLNKDPALIVKILSLSNAPFYGVSGKVLTISDACILLGIQVIKNIILTAGATLLYDPSHVEKIPQLDLKRFWKHSICTGYYCELLAKRKGLNANLAYILGVIHDIGVLVYAVSLQKKLGDILADASAKNLSRRTVEKKIIGVYHEQLSAIVAEHWHLPVEIVTALACHHDPLKADNPEYAAIVHIADVMSNGMGYSIFENSEVQNFDTKVLEAGWVNWKDMEFLTGAISFAEYSSIEC